METLKAVVGVLFLVGAGLAMFSIAMFVLGLTVTFLQFIGRNFARLFNKEEVS